MASAAGYLRTVFRSQAKAAAITPCDPGRRGARSSPTRRATR